MDNQNNEQTGQQETKPDLSNVTLVGEDGQVIPMEENQGKPNGLPEGIESMEQLIDRYNDLMEKSKGADAQDQGQSNDEDQGEDDQDDDGGDDEETQEVDPRDARIKALEIQLHDQELYRQVGGEDAYKVIQDWAGKNLEEGELNLINNILDSSDLSAKKLAIKSLQAMHRDAAGYEGKQVTGSSAVTNQKFTSEAEMHEAMADPRYHRMDSIGEAYRMDVMQRAQGLLSRGNDANGWY